MTLAPHPFNAMQYLFPTLIVAVWEADEQYDRKRGETRPVYATIGVGDQEYLAAIRRVRGGTAAD